MTRGREFDGGFGEEAPFAGPGGPLRRLAAGLEAERARFFLWTPVALGSGIALYFWLPSEPSLGSAAAPLAFALLLRLAAVRGSLMAAVAVAMCLAGAGFLIAKVRAEQMRAPVITKTLRNVDVAGVVEQAEARAPAGQRLTIVVSSFGPAAGVPAPTRVRIRTMAKGVTARAGDFVRLKATLSPPAKPALPGAFDYSRTAWFEGIGAVGYAFAQPAITARGSGDLAPWMMSERLTERVRSAIGARINAVLSGQSAAIATALITGERAAISAQTNAVYKDSGLFHLLSISGLHMVVIAGAVFYALRLAMAAVPFIALRWPTKKIAAVFGIAAAFAYLAISGAAFATVRSALMIVIMFMAVLVDRPALALRNVALAALVILILYPESLLDAGFQMSFAAVTALIAVYEELRQRVRHHTISHPVLRLVMFFGGIVMTTLVASVAVAPFAAYHFHQSQQFAVIANLVAIPVSNIVVMPAALVALIAMPFGLESLPLKIMGAGIDLISWCAGAVSRLPGAVGRIPEIPLAAFAALLASGLWLALWQTRLRLAGLAGLLAGLLMAPGLTRPDLMIGRHGDVVAVRDERGQLSVLAARGSNYEIDKWLAADGDKRSAREASAQGGTFRCDASGCVAEVKGRVVAVARHPSALRDDCARADILVLASGRPKFCARPLAIIDRFDVARAGTHAIYLSAAAGADRGDGDGLRIDTVAARQGDRPWSPQDADAGADGRHRRGGPSAPGVAREGMGERPGARLAKPRVVAPSRGQADRGGSSEADGVGRFASSVPLVREPAGDASNDFDDDPQAADEN